MPYYTRHSDGIGYTVYAAHINELQQGLEAIAQNYLLLPTGWDNGWRAAKAAVATAPATVAVIGDSIAQGRGSSNFLTTSWCAKVRAALTAAYGTYADFYSPAESASYLTSLGSSYAGTPPYVVNGSPTWTVGGLGRIAFYNSALPTPYAWRFTTPYACTAVDVLYLNPYATAGATITMAIDGVAQAPISLPASPTKLMKQSYTGLGNAVHTIDWTGQSANDVGAVAGVTCYAAGATGGIAFAKLAVSSETMHGWGSTSGAIPADRILQLAGQYQDAGGTVHATGLGIPTQPALAILGLGINDCSTAVGPDTYADELWHMLAALRRGNSAGSVLLFVPNFPDGTASDCVPAGFSNNQTWGRYIRSMQAVAQEWKCALANVHGKWGSTGVAQGFQTATDLHPPDAGHADIASLVLSIL